MYRVTGGEFVSASSKIMASPGSRLASSSANRENARGIASPAARSFSRAASSLACLARPISSVPPPGGLRLVGRHRCPEPFGQQTQSELGVAHLPDVDRVVLGDLVGIQVDVYGPGPGREDVAQLWKDLREHVGPANEVDVSPSGDGKAFVAEHMSSHALKQRVAEGHVDLARIRRPYLGTQQFGHPGKLLVRLGLSDTVADENHRLVGRGEQRGDPSKSLLVGNDARRGDRGGVDFLRGGKVQHVHRQANVDRAASAEWPRS